MRVIPLQSGSAGNCIYVEANGIRLLFDAGISGKQAQHRLAAQGSEIRGIDAVIISHDHSDHIGSAGILGRKFGLPVHLTEPTWHAARHALGEGDHIRHFQSGEVLRFASVFGSVTVETMRTPHDAADGVVFVVDEGAHRVGILTDFGHVFPELEALVASLDAVYLESNHDDVMLENGPYPVFLKRRISGPGGHISNHESARLIADHGRKLRWACLAHLSANNNSPEIAYATHRATYGDDLPLLVAKRSAVSAPMVL
ncbi:MAG: MBL fold metallo-hydrolase [Planctomycetes bacterium]|nr:MBL fold metallo-hydrolase [Planctomycetota bacterium]